MIHTITPAELAITAQRLRERVKVLRSNPAPGGPIETATREDLQQLATQAQMMHCPRASEVQMLDAATALMEARMALENQPHYTYHHHNSRDGRRVTLDNADDAPPYWSES